MLLEVQNIKELNYLEHVVRSLKEYGYQVTFLEEKKKEKVERRM